jgi:hypothetical protein
VADRIIKCKSLDLAYVDHNKGDNAMYSGRHQRATARMVEFADVYLFQPRETHMIGQHCHYPCRSKAATRSGIGYETGSQA